MLEVERCTLDVRFMERKPLRLSPRWVTSDRHARVNSREGKEQLLSLNLIRPVRGMLEYGPRQFWAVAAVRPCDSGAVVSYALGRKGAVVEATEGLTLHPAQFIGTPAQEGYRVGLHRQGKNAVHAGRCDANVISLV